MQKSQINFIIKKKQFEKHIFETRKNLTKPYEVSYLEEFDKINRRNLCRNKKEIEKMYKNRKKSYLLIEKQRNTFKKGKKQIGEIKMLIYFTMLNKKVN